MSSERSLSPYLRNSLDSIEPFSVPIGLFLPVKDKAHFGQQYMHQHQEQIEVMLAMARDAQAFGRLVQHYQARLEYYVRRFVEDNNVAQDLLQDVWLLVYRRLPTLISPSAFRVWLYKIAHDVVVNYIRNRAKEHSLQVAISESASVLDDWNEFEALDRAELVHQALPQLSSAHREVLLLRFLEGLDIAEIATVVGCDSGTVKSRLHYGKFALKKILGDIHD